MGSVADLKRHVIEQLLEREAFFLLVIDSSYPGVGLPEHLLEGGQPVGINIGLRLAVPIPDLEFDDGGIHGTLSFNRSPFHCTFPWPSIVQLSVEDEHLVWVLPRREEPAPVTGDDEQSAAEDKRPKLRLV